MKNSTCFTAFLFLVFVAGILPSVQADDHKPVVPGYERFADVEDVADAQKGMLLLNELNCMSCHKGQSSFAMAPKQAPILTGIGGRVLPEYFESFVLDPHGVKPGTMMPNVLAGKPEAEQKEIANAIGQFLASTGKTAKRGSNAALIVEGKKFYHSIGCVACHDPQNEDKHIATSIPFGELDEKYTLSGLTTFLQNPMHTRPSGRMPAFNYERNELGAIASYLLRDTVVDSKINFAYYEGTWSQLPDFEELKPVSTGTAAGFETLVGPKKDGFGVIYTGYWTTDQEAEYKFRLASDDGSRLIIDGKVMVENDKVHGMIFKEGKQTLPAGVHEVRVEFFEAAGGEGLRVEVSGGGFDSVGLETLMRVSKEETNSKDKKGYQYDAVKAAKGKEYFQSLGCASCHEMQVGGAKLSSTFGSASSLKDLKLEGGCFEGTGNAPAFGLSKHQVQCLTVAIKQLKNSPASSATPQSVVHEKLLTLNCYACHNRETDQGIFGGVVDVTGDSEEVFGRKKWFTGTQAEMGDEGQHPPALKSAGAKLNPAWLEKVLNDGVKSRPYMNTKMPKFGGKNVFGELANELISADKLENVPVVVQTEPESKVKGHGRFLAGAEALSCIKCHTFGKYNATGIQAIDLTTMTQRLSKDWFQAYMLKPSKFRRGTRMPESWPGGKSFYPDMLSGDTQKQIDALWAYLADGEKAAKPKGLIVSKLELKATKTPIIYRNFIEGAGARAIGVAYPEQANLAFDAQDCRMAIVWQENFIDASRHWTGRGQGFEPPLGENILKLHDSVVFAADLPEGDWPTEWTDEKRPKFKGYRFDSDRRPIFTYTVGDVTVQDQPIPKVIDERPLLDRKFEFTSTGSKTISYLIAVGDKVEINGDVISIDDRYKTKITNAQTLKVVKRGNKSAAVATFDLSSGSAQTTQSYDW